MDLHVKYVVLIRLLIRIAQDPLRPSNVTPRQKETADNNRNISTFLRFAKPLRVNASFFWFCSFFHISRSLAEHILNAVPQFSANLSVLVIRYLAHQFLYTIQPQGCVAHHIAPDYLFAFSSFNNTVCFQDRAGKQIGSEKLWDIKSSDGDTLYSTKQVQIKDGEMYSLQGWTYGAKHMAIYSMKDCALLHKFPVMKLASCFTIIPESGTIVVVSSNCISTYKRDGRVEGSAITNVHDAHGVAYYDKEIYISNLIRNEIQVKEALL